MITQAVGAERQLVLPQTMLLMVDWEEQEEAEMEVTVRLEMIMVLMDQQIQAAAAVVQQQLVHLQVLVV